MEKFALLVRLEAKPGKETEVEDFLKGGLSLALEEPGTKAWYALKIGPSTFGIFDTFSDENGRQAHLTGKIAAALMAKAEELFSTAPVIEKVDLIAVK
ncbi:MAG: antibiotic biosynthesis monooxygenase [Ginsengibacter sp.]